MWMMVKSRLRANLEDGLRNYKSVSEKPVLANIVSSKVVFFIKLCTKVTSN